jgi:sugar phosphate isomerase/epimerase
MNIEFYCPLWGSDQISFDDFISNVSAAGYDGVEMPFPIEEPEERERRAAALKAAGLKLIAQHWETETGDPEAHADEYEKRLRNLAAADPEFISSQTGRDFFEFEDGLAILARAAKVSEETGTTITHETHRSKLTFAAHITRRFLEKLPKMRLTLDVSHWFCVHERFLADQEDALALAISRTDHIHARIGHDQGSQVTDFRMPEWKGALERHLSVWDRIIERARNEGREKFTVTPEFGPSPYMLCAPGTDKPMAVQWDMNVDMMNLLRDRWS